MEVFELERELKKEVFIAKVEPGDFKLLTKKRYFFSWKNVKGYTSLYKLCLKDSKEILGVMAIVDWPKEERIEIKLLACSTENTGRNKEHEGIAGNLIAYACRLAVTQYGKNACISLYPKTNLIEHYRNAYQMKKAGPQLYLDGIELNNILIKYFYENQ